MKKKIVRKRKLLFVKIAVIGLALMLAVFGFENLRTEYTKIEASSSGPSPSHTNAPGESNCTACHSEFSVNSGTGKISVAGIPANYLPNQQIPVTVTVSQENAVVFGFQLTAIDSKGKQIGTFTLPNQTPQQMQIVTGQVGGNPRQYVEHTISGVTPTQFDTKSWTFNFKVPAQRVGKISFYAAGNAANSDRTTNGDYIYTTSKPTLSGTAISNFDGDEKSDVAVFRPSNGTWYWLKSANNEFSAAVFGQNGDKPVPGDYDADGKTDLAVFRSGIWYVQRSSDNAFYAINFGLASDIPVSGDFDGDLKTDIAVFRTSNGVWYIVRSSDGSYDFRQFGYGTDKPVQADYDADGKTDIAVWRPENGVWYIWKSSDNAVTYSAFGQNGDKPVQADYDGDGKTDIAVFRPSNGVWYFLNSSSGFSGFQFGISTDKPIPADYDGDGKSDVAVFREGVWYIQRSSGGFLGIAFGYNSDVPIPANYISE